MTPSLPAPRMPREPHPSPSPFRALDGTLHMGCPSRSVIPSRPAPIAPLLDIRRCLVYRRCTLHPSQEESHMDSMDNVRERFDALEQQTEPLKQQTQALEAQTQRGERRRGTVRALLLQIATLLGACGIALGSVTPAHAEDIQCGAVLGPGGRFALKHDLDCGPSIAVTIQDGAILDLQGHIVTCTGSTFPCIRLRGTGAQLLNGAVDGGHHESIVLEGSGGHTVRNVTSTLADNNILVQSDHNQLINVYAASTINPAFHITGNHNRLTDSIAHCDVLGVLAHAFRLMGTRTT